MQLEEEDADSLRYASLGSAIDEINAANDLIEGRLDLIQKADGSKVGWSAAVHYEKSNGLLLKSDSGKLWEDAERKVLEIKKSSAKEAKDKAPFRYGPGGSGRYSSSQKSKGCLPFNCSLLVFSVCLLCWFRGARPLFECIRN